MFNPEFRIMFTQEADNEFMRPNNRSIEMIFLISVITLIFVIGVSYIAYTSLLLGIQLINNIWHLLPNSILTPGNEFLEIGLILLSLAAAGFMFSAMKGFSELIDGKITKLINDNQTKDVRIKALEAEIDKKIQIINELELTITDFEEKETKKEHKYVDEAVDEPLTVNELYEEIEGTIYSYEKYFR
jgi:hypothetical protein